MMDVFCENREWVLSVNYFRKKTPTQMFDWVLKTPLEIKCADQKIPENLEILRCVMENYQAKIFLFFSF